jgi:hypothetical protein
MRRLLLLGVAALTAVGAASSHQPPPIAGIHWARGAARTSSSPNMTWHGGQVLTSGAVVQPIFWGTTWTSGNPKIGAMQSFYEGMSGSSYAATTTEYTDGSGHVGTTIDFQGSFIDNSAAVKNGNRTSPILNEVCRVIPNPVANGYYPVYVDSPRGGSPFCAWHSAASCNGVPVQFAFFYNLDGDSGCDPQDSATGNSQPVAALGNVSGHELSEALTDPRLNAWYDSNGSENADKCVWSFGSPFVTFSNGTNWKIQGNWSNHAYSTRTGYPNSNGQLGCIDGGNFK